MLPQSLDETRGRLRFALDRRDKGVAIRAQQDHPLIFFHFQGLRKGLRWFIFNSHRSYRAPFSRTVRDHIYKPYVDELLGIEKTVAPILQISAAKPHRRAAVVDIGQYLKSRARNIRVRVFQLLDIVTRRAFFVFRGTAH